LKRTTEEALEFPLGIPGFEDERGFRLVRHATLEPLVLLQSEKTAELCFLALPVERIVEDYDLAVTESECEALRLDPAAVHPRGDGLLGLAIVTVPENGPPTANLLAPVVVNVAAGRGVQSVRADRRYSHQHAIGVEEAACS
jgi:flagellar assembly factor FliW